MPDGKFKTKIIQDGKTYVRKSVSCSRETADIACSSAESELKLVLGGFIQVNFEDSDAFAFNGNFGQSAIKDRFRLRRARVNLTGDFAEQFDFKIEGDFGQNDGTNSNRTGIFGHRHLAQLASISLQRKSKSANVKRHSDWTSLLQTSSLYTIERTLPTGAITPDRQIGAQLWGKPFTNIWPEQKDLLTYYAGIFNGNGTQHHRQRQQQLHVCRPAGVEPCSKAKFSVRDPFSSLALTFSTAAMTRVQISRNR